MSETRDLTNKLENNDETCHGYLRVTNRGVTRSTDGGVGISFDTARGETIRLLLTVNDAAWICGALTDSLLGLLIRIPHVEAVRDTEFGRVTYGFPIRKSATEGNAE